MNDIIPEFKTRTGAQKVHVVCLTDGDGNPLRAGKKYVDRDGTESLFASHMGAGYILRDRTVSYTHLTLPTNREV